MKSPLLGCAVLLSLSGCAFEQPPVRCIVGRGGHAVRYVLKEGSGACASKKPEIVGVQKYNPPGAQTQTVALQPDALFRLVGEDADESHSPISLGSLREDMPGQDGFCRVQDVSEGRQQVTEEPGVDVRYAWSDVRFHVSAAAPGTQWLATVRYTEGTCSATYEAIGVFPAVSCHVRNDDGDLEYNEDGTPKTDARLCREPDYDTLLALDESFPVRCDEASALCVLDSDSVPAFKRGN
ncbi:MAG TPA: hypothetical protein VFZ09_13100 [Archangium sp.]|uniref:hypothetical protein n=1 Tax=Archangium sp. TaxID=1872627 RepID=UPI002E35D472|nr:hypothetical protein [Archangium sp.]HEX5747173.1 hypothetical protein [Archangium sp.]